MFRSFDPPEPAYDAVSGTTLATDYTYDAAGRMLFEDGPLAGDDDASFYRYDSLGRRTWEIGPRGANTLRIATRTTYRDADDKPVKVERGTLPNSGSTTLTVLSTLDTSYDTRRNPIRAKTSAAGTTLTVADSAYDDRGEQLCATVRMNLASLPTDACTLGTAGTQGPDRITHNVYDTAGQLTKVQKAYGTSLQQDYATYTYSANGKQAGVTDANGNLATLGYDGDDRLAKWTFPSKTVPGTVNASDYESYLYDANGNRTSLRKRDGSTLTYTYDNLNRVTKKVVPERSGLPATDSRDVYYAYDMRDLQLYARFDSATGEGVTNAYDGFGRLSSSAINMDGTTRTLSYQYDVDSNRTRVTHPDGTYFAYAYDPASRLTTIKENGSTTLVTATYNPSGLPSSIARVGSSSTLGYDGIDRLTGLTHDLAGTSSDVSWTQGYNPASQVLTATRTNDAYAWTGSVDVTCSYAVNGLNQYTTAGSASFGYDANGDLTSDGSNTYLYDIENRLVTTSGAHSATLRYDPLGRLYETVAGAVTTRFLDDGDALVGEYNGAGTMTARYVHGASAGDDPLIWYNGATVSSTTRRQLYPDHQGSIVGVVDGSGTLLTADSYDEYGNPAATNSGRFQYTGQAWVPELGLYYYKARMYSPALGRFMQVDPVGYDGGINLYAYVGNDPVNGTDPTGKVCSGPEASDCAPRYQATSQPKRSQPNVQGGPLNGQHANSHSFTPSTSPRAGALRAYYGGYYTKAESGYVFHSDAKTAAIVTGGIAAAALAAPAAGAALAAEGVAATGGDHIVLGLANFGLEDTAAQVGGRTLLSDPAYQQTLMNGLGDSSTRFTLSLEGLSGDSVYSQVMGAAQRGVAGVGGATDGEIGQIYQSGRLGDIGLYSGGQYIPNPFGP